MMYRVVYILLLFCLVSVDISAQQTGRVYIASEAMDGDGAEVLRLFPSKDFKHADPFILLDDFSVSSPAGFPAHPHKGFEAITYMIAGGFVHKDNLGNNDTILEGQAQRFTAGKGLVHSEMPGTISMNKGLQLWLNIPVTAKQGEPTYQTVKFLPLQSTDSTRIVRTIVGSGSSLVVNCGCDLSYVDVQLKKDSISFSPIFGYTSFVYVIEGDIQIKNTKMIAGEFYFLESGLTHTIIGGTSTRFVYLSAMPLNQPIKQRGPYVY
ncbi:MAG TPA: pirin family protein [Cytophaga sp.]|nr:pirin family protein [Cytophaga sp.]